MKLYPSFVIAAIVLGMAAGTQSMEYKTISDALKVSGQKHSNKIVINIRRR